MDLRASYTDSYPHAFDAKGRITVPADWRQPHFETSLYVFPSSDRCVKVYPASWLGQLLAKLESLKDADPQKKAIGDLATQAQSAVFDTQGRIMIKERLRESAGLKRDAMLVGKATHFQIWDQSAWEKHDTTALTVEKALAAANL